MEWGATLVYWIRDVGFTQRLLYCGGAGEEHTSQIQIFGRHLEKGER